MTRFFRALLVGLASAAVLFFGWEFGLRMIDGVPFDPSLNFVGRDLGAQIHGADRQFRYDPDLGWVLKENYTSKAGDFTTGELGLRAHNAVKSNYPAGAILAVGDSFTVGDEVPDQASWPAHLERILGRPVLNGATGGYSVGQIVLRAESLVEKLRPSLLIVSIIDQDILRDTYRTFYAPKPYFDIVDGRLVRRNNPVPRVDDMARDSTPARKYIGQSYFLYKLSLTFGFYDWLIANEARLVRVHSYAEAVRISCLLFERLSNFGKQRSLPIIFMMQYGMAASAREEPSWYGRDVMQCARSLEFAAVIDAHAALHAIASRDPKQHQELYVLRDTGVRGHMSSAGNELMAKLLADVIAKP